MNKLQMLAILILLLLLSPVTLSMGMGAGNDSVNGSVNGAEPLILSDKTDVYPLGQHLKLLEDKQANLTIKDVRTPIIARSFKPNKKTSPGFGFTTSAYWAKFDLNNRSNQTKRWLFEIAFPLHDEVEVYVFNTNGPLLSRQTPSQQWQTGDSLPFASRPYDNHNFVFPLVLQPQQTVAVYVRLKSDNSMLLPFTLWSVDSFNATNVRSILGLGLYYGIMLVMMLYNAFVYVSVRDKSYLFYIIYLLFFSLSVLNINGLGMQFLWPNAPWWSNQGFMIFMFQTAFWGVLFSQHFLRLKTQAPLLNHLFNLMSVLSLLAMMMAIYTYPKYSLYLSVVIAVAFVSLIMTAAIYLFKQNYRPARFFLLAWTGFLVGVVMRMLFSTGVISGDFIFQHGVQLGSAIEVILLSLALADRINALKEQARENAELARQYAEQANQAKSVFVADVSHEIRTPLNAILGFTQLLDRDPQLGPSQRQKIEIIEKSGAHLLALINNILDISKIESNAMTLQTEDFELVGLVKSIGVMLGVRCDEKHLMWRFVNNAEQTVSVHGDHTKLRQILINLLGNAVKFTQRGSITLVLSNPANNHYCFEVIDTGIGIELAQQQAIFAAFGQTVQGIKAGGTGLGLAIASRQVALMGGFLQLSSEPNQGSRFFFTIKLAPAHHDIQTSQQRARKEFKIAPGITINALVVDDLKENRDALCQMLQHIGLSVTETNTGEGALMQLQQMQSLPEFVFIDIRMPVMDGVNTMAAIGRLFALQNKKPTCIAVTANAMQQDIDSCLNLGFDHYITKPFRFSTLCDAIVRFMPPALAHQIEQTQQINAGAPSLDLSGFDMPPKLYRALSEAADVYEVSKLEIALEELAKLSVQGQQMADKLGHFITNYDMDGLLGELEKINVTAHSDNSKFNAKDSQDE